jgi:hypothetical protein
VDDEFFFDTIADLNSDASCCTMGIF